jgi:hypothetical protein
LVLLFGRSVESRLDTLRDVGYPARGVFRDLLSPSFQTLPYPTGDSILRLGFQWHLPRYKPLFPQNLIVEILLA